MEFVRLVPEDQASGDVQQVYDDIKSRYQIDFVPNIMKAWAHKPDSLKANWDRIKHHEDVLGLELAHAVGLCIAAQSPCTYCLHFHRFVLEKQGWSSEKIENLVSWAAQSAGGNLYANGLNLMIEQQISGPMMKAA